MEDSLRDRDEIAERALDAYGEWIKAWDVPRFGIPGTFVAFAAGARWAVGRFDVRLREPQAEETQAEIVERVRVMAEGCCGDDSWRGRFCQYHAGYRDGIDDALFPIPERAGE